MEALGLVIARQVQPLDFWEAIYDSTKVSSSCTVQLVPVQVQRVQYWPAA